MTRGRRATSVVLAVALASGAAAALPPSALPLGAPPTAHAAATGTVDRAVLRLQAAQRSDGGFGKQPGAAASDPATSVWAALALAAVGVHPDDQPAKGTTVLTYLRRQAGKLEATGDLARLVLVLRPAAQGDSPAAAKAIAALRARQATDGGVPDGATGKARVESTAFAVLALAGGSDDDRAAAVRGAAWLVSARGDADGWGDDPRAVVRVRPTAAAVQALDAAGALGPDTTEAPAAQRFLTDAVNADDGGIRDRAGASSDPVSTAWGVQGLKTVGVDPLNGDVTGAIGDVRTYLKKLQRADGGFGTTMRTAQVLPGLNGTVLPLAKVSRGSDLASRSAPGDGRKNAAKTSGTGGGSDGVDDAKADQDGTSGSAGSSDASSSGASGGTSSGSAGGSSPAAPTAAPGVVPPAPAPSTAPVTPLPTTPPTTSTAAAPPTTTAPTTTTRPTPPTTADGGTQVGGTVVGAGPAAAPAGVDAGGGTAGDDDAVGITLVGVLVVLFVAGTQLERRRPRRIAP